MKLLAVCGLVTMLASAAVASAQAPDVSATNPVSDTVRHFLARDSKNLIASAELMPDEKYAFRPTPAQISFGQLVLHVVQTNEVLLGDRRIAQGAADGFERYLAERRDGAGDPSLFSTCADAFAKVTDAQLADEIPMGPRASVRRGFMVITIATDWADHYSTAAGYLRLNGLLPPSAQPPR